MPKQMTDEEIHEALCDIDENAKGLSAETTDLIESLVYGKGDEYTPDERYQALELIEKYWKA